MSDFVEVDVRGLSCPEPVLMVMDVMDEHPGKQIRVLGDEAQKKYIGKSGGIGSSETFKKEWSADRVIPLLFGV